MRIGIATPAGRGSSKGNRITAVRWAGLLRQLGHHVAFFRDGRAPGGRWDVLIALHAIKSAAAVAHFERAHPDASIVLALTGTDLYEPANLASVEAQAAIAAADRLVLLQPAARAVLDDSARKKAVVIHQSARPPRPHRPDPTRAPERFRVCLLAHLRDVKNPLLAVEASRLLPPDSRVEIVHVGEALSDEAAARARQAESERYRWLGAVPHAKAQALLASSDLLLVSSRLEGGANVVSEALACGVPVASTRIDGSTGILGDDYPALFPAGDAAALAALLSRCETDRAFYAELRRRTAALRTLVYPARERAAWRTLLADIAPPWRERLEVGPAGAAPGKATFERDVVEGLTASPKRLSCEFLYDAAGSLLFEAITDLEEYYPTRAERQILRERGETIARRFSPRTRLFELGGGTGAKTRLLVDAFQKTHGSVPYEAVDISAQALADCAAALLPGRPQARMRAHVGSWDEGIDRVLGAGEAPKLVLYLGSNIGNMNRADAASFLRRIGERLTPDDGLLLGVDLRKSKAVLERAYDDSEGVTAAFNLNLLERANRELGASFDVHQFRHRARYDEAEGRIEMYLDSLSPQTVRVAAGTEVRFEAGEAVHTENSYKYSAAELDALTEAAGLTVEARWFDAEERFCVLLLRGGRG